MSDVENTTKRDPLLLLAESMMARDSNEFIGNMESKGQRELVASTLLPVPSDVQIYEKADPARFAVELSVAFERWAKVGIIYGERVEGDDLFWNGLNIWGRIGLGLFAACYICFGMGVMIWSINGAVEAALEEE